VAITLRQFTEYPPLTLYVHFPWCVKKCPYCDFNSHAVKKEIPERAYLDALVIDLEQHAPDIWGRPVEAIFFGGGTPSLISNEGMDYLMGKIRALTRLQPDAEITLEANPGTLESGRFAGYRQSGINRLSIGVQSFNNDSLQALGRIHDSGQAIAACESVRDAGFENFNIDLMHGLPGQRAEQAAADVATAIALDPTHISYYQLTIEPNTLFHARPPTLPVEDDLWAIQDDGQHQLAQAGYMQYEVSAFARPDRQCLHNVNYWLFGDYLGIGAGAHSKLTFPAHNAIHRLSKHRHPDRYLDTSGDDSRIQTRTILEGKDSRLEFMMNALRLCDGFESGLFASRTGEALHTVSTELDQAESLGLISRTHLKIAPTLDGQRHLNSLLELFMPDADGGVEQAIVFQPREQ
jgi:oxygen-independent coproporphyrinogen-3 oxidase